ncbi:MAG TPA: SMP-30/gluconolactonase/LRE family protein [Polyangiaceae bacterium]
MTAVAAPAEQSKPPTPQGHQTERASICAGGEYPAAPVQETKASLVKDGFVFVEGPVWSDQLGSLLFSEMDFTADGSNGPPSKIHLLTPDRQLFTFLENSGSNGLAIDGKGVIAATHAPQALTRIDLSSKQRTTLVDAVGGKKFNSPNDLVVSHTGHVYFTDPDWQLGKRANETGMTGVYWVKPDGAVTLVDGKLDKPNGVSLSPDDKTLYVSALDNGIWAYSIDAGGKPAKRRLFASVDGPDGMAMDCAGNLYATSHGPGTVEVFDRTGKKLTSIAVAPKTTNAAFGGHDRKTLYITAGTGVYALPTLVPGFPY